jgi:cell fate (sporulation/competence/biofilm development) regulator YlbF (YheA/YmcA/DUF963 family)
MMKERIEFQRARELGRVLADSGELFRLRKAQAALQLDKEAEGLYRQLQVSGEDIQDSPANPVIAELLSAQKEFNGLLKDVNGIIGFYVTGQESIEIKRENCSGCRGCKG